MIQRTIEIGHTYAPERLVPLKGQNDMGGYDFGDTERAARLRTIAETLGSDALRVAFVDDVIANDRRKRSEHDSWRHALFIGVSGESVQAGTGAQLVEFESRFEGRARQMVDEIRSADLPGGYRLSSDQNRLVIGSGKDRTRIPLVGFQGIEDGTYPSCEMLDLAWLERRLELAPEAITVLPHGYEEQQEQVEFLTKLFPHIKEKSFATIFAD